MNLTELGLLAAGGAVASESVGVTDFTPIGRGDEDDEQTPGGGVGGGVGSPFDFGSLFEAVGDARQSAETAAALASIGSGTGGGTTVVETVRERIPVPTSGGGGGGFGGFDWGGSSTPRGGDGTKPRQTSGDRFTPRQAAAAASGRDPFGLQATGDGWLSDLGEIGRVTGKTANEAGRFGTDFAGENPYFTGLTGTGAALGSIVPGAGTAAGAATGAAVGGVTEVTADTITGGTPLGVQSPLDVTSGGAWWQGSDPLNLGPDGSDGDEPDTSRPDDSGAADSGNGREQDRREQSGSSDSGGGVGPTVGGVPAIGPAVAGPLGLGGGDGSDDPAASDGGTNREQDKRDEPASSSGGNGGGAWYSGPDPLGLGDVSVEGPDKSRDDGRRVAMPAGPGPGGSQDGSDDDEEKRRKPVPTAETGAIGL